MHSPMIKHSADDRSPAARSPVAREACTANTANTVAVRGGFSKHSPIGASHSSDEVRSTLRILNEAVRNAVKHLLYGKHCMKCHTVWVYDCDSVPAGRQLIATGASPVVRDETTAEVPNGTTGIAIWTSDVVLSGLNTTSKHCTTGSRPCLSPGVTS